MTGIAQQEGEGCEQRQQMHLLPSLVSTFERCNYELDLFTRVSAVALERVHFVPSESLVMARTDRLTTEAQLCLESRCLTAGIPVVVKKVGMSSKINLAILRSSLSQSYIEWNPGG